MPGSNPRVGPGWRTEAAGDPEPAPTHSLDFRRQIPDRRERRWPKSWLDAREEQKPLELQALKGGVWIQQSLGSQWGGEGTGAEGCMWLHKQKAVSQAQNQGAQS